MWDGGSVRGAWGQQGVQWRPHGGRCEVSWSRLRQLQLGLRREHRAPLVVELQFRQRATLQERLRQRLDAFGAYPIALEVKRGDACVRREHLGPLARRAVSQPKAGHLDAGRSLVCAKRVDDLRVVGQSARVGTSCGALERLDGDAGHGGLHTFKSWCSASTAKLASLLTLNSPLPPGGGMVLRRTDSVIAAWSNVCIFSPSRRSSSLAKFWNCADSCRRFGASEALEYSPSAGGGLAPAIPGAPPMRSPLLCRWRS
eukprot:2787039-Prymnesium_polylepis.1